MKTTNTKHKIADAALGAAVGAVIAGPAGAVAGVLIGSQVAAHNPHAPQMETPPAPEKHDGGNPSAPPQLKRS